MKLGCQSAAARPADRTWLSGGGLLERGGTVSEGKPQLSALQGALAPWPGNAERRPAVLQSGRGGLESPLAGSSPSAPRAQAGQHRC